MESFSWVAVVEAVKRSHPQLYGIFAAALDVKVVCADQKTARLGLILAVVMFTAFPRSGAYVQDAFSVLSLMCGASQNVCHDTPTMLFVAIFFSF